MKLNPPAEPYETLMRDGQADGCPEPLRSTDAAKLTAAHAIQLESLHRSGKQDDKRKSVKPLFFKD